MLDLQNVEPMHVLGILVIIVVLYCMFLKKPEDFGKIPRLGPIDEIVDSYSNYMMPYSFGIPHNSSLCHHIGNRGLCKSKINCKWDNYNGCRYYGEGKIIESDCGKN
jgi:hypothetical protein